MSVFLKKIFCIAAVLTGINLSAQNTLDWHHHVSSPQDNIEWQMVLDQNGYAIVVGQFKGTTDFDPGASTVFHSSTGGSFDIFVEKIAPTGELVWVQTFGGNGTDTGFSCDVDNSGNIYVTGSYSGVFDFDPGAGVSNSVAIGLNEIFLLKLDANGVFQWVKTYGGIGTDTGKKLKVDQSGFIYVTGSFSNSTDFDPLATLMVLNSNGGTDAFMMKVDPSGNTLWAKSVGSTGEDVGTGVFVNGTGIVFAGNFSASADIDPNGGTVITPQAQDIYLVKLNNSLTTAWAHFIGGTGNDYAADLAMDNSGNVYLTGTFENTVDFDISAANNFQVSAGLGDAFVLKWDSNANFQMVKKFGGSGDDKGHAVSVDNFSNIYVTGSFVGTADLDPGPAVSSYNSFGAFDDWFYTKLRSNGTSKWIYAAGGTDVDKPGDIYVDNLGGIRASGTFQVGINIAPTGATILTGGGGYDHAIARWDQCTDRDTLITANECASYIMPGGTVIAASGIYHDTIPTVDGCDSLITVNLTISGFPMVEAGQNVTVCDGDSVTLFASGNASVYDWSNGIQDGQSFFPPVGVNNYILEGSFNNGCSSLDTVTVTVLVPQDFSVSPDQYFCLGDTVQLSASGAFSYSWEGVGNNSTYDIAPTGDYAVYVYGHDSFGCVKEKIIQLTMDDPSAVDAGTDQTVCPGYPVTLSGSGGVEYYWDGPNGETYDMQEITIYTDSATYYHLLVVTANGCQYIDSVLISVDTTLDCELVFWNAFTPNNDGVNDFFFILGVEQYADNQLVIYNRWGDAVRTIDAYDNDQNVWDGLNENGQPLAPGTYYYLLTIETGTTRAYKGWVQLLR